MEVKTTKVKIAACSVTPRRIDGNRLDQLLMQQQEVQIQRNDDGRFVFSTMESISALLSEAADLVEPGAYQVQVTGDQLNSLIQGDTTVDLLNAEWHHDRDFCPSAEVTTSLRGRVRVIEEDIARGLDGLRDPQVGAVFALRAHFRTQKTDPVTVVMPTGTGKSDVMVAAYCFDDIGRLLVLVPSDALRSQIGETFAKYGVLKKSGVVDQECRYPIIGQIEHAFTSIARATEFAQYCNIAIATPDSLSACSPEIREAFCSHFGTLFVDEAHHIPATSWDSVRQLFDNKRVIQFTATPYREDRVPLGGKILFEYPLRLAQERKYYAKINYRSVVAIGSEDEEIAKTAIAALNEDLHQYNHILMARVKTINRANEILRIYRRLASDHNPILMHSKLPKDEREAGKQAMKDGSSRIVVCVDMLGEGFDLPTLKIAAIHDPFKTLAITLQFVGRFARTRPDLGDATVVVARPVGQFDEQVRRLYGEDEDWNALINDLSRESIESEEEISRFNAAFVDTPTEISPLNLFPKMSTVVFRTPTDSWYPDRATELHPIETLYTYPIPLNVEDNVMWYVVQHLTPVRWGDGGTIDDTVYELFVVHFDPESRLLYVNSSINDGHHQKLARVLCGETTELISGETIYRIYGKVDWLVPTNIGLLDSSNPNRSFTMLSGDDVTEGYAVAEAQTKTKTNIYGYGYESGNRVGYGGSLRGRVWSIQVAKTLKHWVDWCHEIGEKLIDESIDVSEIQRNFIRPVRIAERPPLVALAMQWSPDVLTNFSDSRSVKYGDFVDSILDVGLEITDPSSEGPIRFVARTSSWSLEYEVGFGERGLIFTPVGDDAIISGRSRANTLGKFMETYGVHIIFEKETVVTPSGLMFQVNRDLPLFPDDRIRAIDWPNTNIRVESQGPELRADSVQARMIAWALNENDWDLVIDDDSANEVADIVCLKTVEKSIQVMLIHCKYSSEDDPGARVADLYEVCGQAMRSTLWKRSTIDMIENLLRREQSRRRAGYRNGIMKGDDAELFRIMEASKRLRPQFSIAIAQPGMSKAKASPGQRALLAGADAFISIRTGGELEVFSSR